MVIARIPQFHSISISIFPSFFFFTPNRLKARMTVKAADIKPAIMMLATIINTMTYVKEYDNYRWP